MLATTCVLYNRWLTDTRRHALLQRVLEGACVTLRANTLSALLQACAGGGGLAILPCFVADREPAIERVESPAPVPSCELWLVARRSRQRVARVRTLLDALAAAFARDQALLQGAPLPRASHARSHARE